MRIHGLTVARAGALRADTATPETLILRFSPFNTWYEINSYWEGRFLERTVPGAFKRTISQAKRADGKYSTKVLFNHGMDFGVGDKVLGVPTEFAERADSPELIVPLDDTSYNRDLIPGLRSGAYGSSFIFEVLAESWVREPEPSDANPDGLPERTLTEVRVHEAGPVTWPANPAATAGLRSLTDHLMDARVSRLGASMIDQHAVRFKAFRAAFGTPDYVPSAERTRSTPAPGDPVRHVAQHADRETAIRDKRLRAMKGRIHGGAR